MASSINASTSAGVVTTADTSGILALQTANTTAVTIDASQKATFVNDASISGLTVGKGGGSESNSTAVGYQALNATNTGGYNTAFGWKALNANTSGAINTAVGFLALGVNTTGGANTGIGEYALSNTTTGGYNTAIGAQALQLNTTASNNTAVGYQAGYTNGATAGYNVFLGYQAGYTSNAGTANSYNTFVGPQAGYSMTTGYQNTILGGYNGNQGGLDIRTSNNYIVLSDGAGNPRGVFDNTGAFLTAGATSNSNTTLGIKLTPDAVFGANICSVVGSATSGSFTGFNLYSTGSGSQRFYADYAGTLHAVSTSIAAISDQSLKENVVDIEPSLNKIIALRPVRFDWKQEMQIEQKQIQGFIAQEVENVLPDLVYDYQYNDTEIKKSIKMGDMIPTLVKAIQELNAEVTALKAKLGA